MKDPELNPFRKGRPSLGRLASSRLNSSPNVGAPIKPQRVPSTKWHKQAKEQEALKKVQEMRASRKDASSITPSPGTANATGPPPAPTPGPIASATPVPTSEPDKPTKPAATPVNFFATPLPPPKSSTPQPPIGESTKQTGPVPVVKPIVDVLPKPPTSTPSFGFPPPQQPQPKAPSLTEPIVTTPAPIPVTVDNKPTGFALPAPAVPSKTPEPPFQNPFAKVKPTPTPFSFGSGGMAFGASSSESVTKPGPATGPPASAPESGQPSGFKPFGETPQFATKSFGGPQGASAPMSASPSFGGFGGPPIARKDTEGQSTTPVVPVTKDSTAPTNGVYSFGGNATASSSTPLTFGATPVFGGLTQKPDDKPSATPKFGASTFGQFGSVPAPSPSVATTNGTAQASTMPMAPTTGFSSAFGKVSVPQFGSTTAPAFAFGGESPATKPALPTLVQGTPAFNLTPTNNVPIFTMGVKPPGAATVPPRSRSATARGRR